MRSIISFLLTGLIVLGLAHLLPGVEVSSFWGALLVALVLGILNAFVRPILVFLTLPATLITFGLFLWVINAIIILLASWFLGDYFHVTSFWWALLFSFLLSVVISFVNQGGEKA
ncbi:MAG TPA: phage holin family protein [Moheibacter sp.]|nr:phage holin family protein [Moheibacter sp.]